MCHKVSHHYAYVTHASIGKVVQLDATRRDFIGFIDFFVLLFSLFEAATMYGSVSQYDGHAIVWVEATFAHLKGDSIRLNV